MSEKRPKFSERERKFTESRMKEDANLLQNGAAIREDGALEVSHSTVREAREMMEDEMEDKLFANDEIQRLRKRQSKERKVEIVDKIVVEKIGAIISLRSEMCKKESDGKYYPIYFIEVENAEHAKNPNSGSMWGTSLGDFGFDENYAHKLFESFKKFAQDDSDNYHDLSYKIGEFVDEKLRKSHTAKTLN